MRLCIKLEPNENSLIDKLIKESCTFTTEIIEPNDSSLIDKLSKNLKTTTFTARFIDPSESSLIGLIDKLTKESWDEIDNCNLIFHDTKVHDISVTPEGLSLRTELVTLELYYTTHNGLTVSMIGEINQLFKDLSETGLILK